MEFEIIQEPLNTKLFVLHCQLVEQTLKLKPMGNDFIAKIFPVYNYAVKGPYKILRQFARTLFERLEHHPRTHPYKRSSVIKVSDRISEMYLTL